jgi:hypothetical protein
VDDAALVRCADRARRLAQEHDRALDRQRARREPGLEVLAAQPLHQEVRAVGVISDVVDLHDARVVNARRRPGLVEEPGDDVAQRRHLRLEHLDHRLGPRVDVGREVHIPEAALVP